jgi:hypothetical protein
MNEEEKRRSGKITLHNEVSWVIEITKDGIRFNRENFPEWLADDFVREFIEVLERNGYVYKPH